MKKAVSIVLILMCALLALSACGKKNGTTKNSSANTCNGTATTPFSCTAAKMAF